MAHNGTLSRIRQRRRNRIVPSTGGAKRTEQTSPPRAQYDDELLRPAEAARLLNLTPRCLQDWRLKGIGPRFSRMTPKLVQYRRSGLEEFITSCELRVCDVRSKSGVREVRI
jgi:hypothetical protein